VHSDAPEVFEAAEAALDDVAALIGLLVVADALLATGFAGSRRLNVGDFEEHAELGQTDAGRACSIQANISQETLAEMIGRPDLA
jgi:hypothetical protein